MSWHSVEHLAGAGMESSGTTWSFRGWSTADSMFVGACLDVAGGGTGAVEGGVVLVVDGDEVAAACWTLNRSHEESKSAAMASSVLYESASSLHESAKSSNEPVLSLSAAVRTDGEGAGDARTQTGAGVAPTLGVEEAGRGAATGVGASVHDACAAVRVADATTCSGANWICIRQQLL